jgi:integrase
MASVFKLGRDKKKRRSSWYFEYLDEQGKKRMRKGFSDKALTEQLAVKLETQARQLRLGLIDGEQAALAESKRTDIETHLADYEGHLKARKNSAKYVSQTMGRVRRVLNEASIQVLGGLTEDAVQKALLDLRKAEDLGHRTYNHYVQAVEGFCLWLVRKHRLPSNPIAGMERLNAATDVRHRRRALTAKEFALLLQSALTSGVEVQCYDGPTRARIYLFSYLTGLRRGELASLTPASFDLSADPPTLKIEATISKHRRLDVLPLHEELACLLRDWLPTLGKKELLFPKLARRRTWLMVKKDLERVGIPYETDEGIADFHASGRHSYITELLRNGASLVETRQLARHADVNMTMRYAHIGLADQAKALRGLPAPTLDPCQDIVRKPSVSPCPPLSSPDLPRLEDRRSHQIVTPCEESPSVADGQKKSPPGKGGEKWRRRESNPRPAIAPRELLRV